eukprot:scaffold108993_cov33-Phaeocystis_antarctica.AAC.1
MYAATRPRPIKPRTFSGGRRCQRLLLTEVPPLPPARGRLKGRNDAAPLRLRAEPGSRDVTVAEAAALLRIQAPRISSGCGLRDRRCGRGGASVRRWPQPGKDDDGAGAFVERLATSLQFRLFRLFVLGMAVTYYPSSAMNLRFSSCNSLSSSPRSNTSSRETWDAASAKNGAARPSREVERISGLPDGPRCGLRPTRRLRPLLHDVQHPDPAAAFQQRR